MVGLVGWFGRWLYSVVVAEFTLNVGQMGTDLKRLVQVSTMVGGWYLFVLYCFGLVGVLLLFLSLVGDLESLCGVGDFDFVYTTFTCFLPLNIFSFSLP